jgi:RNA polymerase sigma-70 factor (ECF subfamily)
MMSSISESFGHAALREGGHDERATQDVKSERFHKEALIHLDALYGTALRLTRKPSQAEDLVQDTVLRAWLKWHQFSQGTHAKAWLLRIMTHLFINNFRRQRQEREILSDPEHPKFKDRFFDSKAASIGSDPEQCYFANHLSGPVHSALDALGPLYRSTVVLSDLQGLSYREIAEIMQCPLGTVMSRLFRARRLLKQRLQEHAQEHLSIEP